MDEGNGFHSFDGTDATKTNINAEKTEMVKV